MRNSTRLIIYRCSILFFILGAGFNSIAQEVPKADNAVHDRMFNLITVSNKVVLPDSVIQYINDLNQDSPHKQKYTSSHLAVYRVLYNPTLSKADRRFFANEILNKTAAVWVPLQAHLKMVAKKI